ncbi:hypothetical protein GN244_ATG16905 [Phytophthora infestans]|uniref:Uncharacterized protein n=1 Tax=Phytophthora infestans TaxID=4787 RepID=A0A833S2H1_PHYIN|nr:hypothetical protein GN244_ATG16905 [Phytophthora infestans]KAF4128128.1 hypothetical protein GN958_ATG22674 [Phytophthora infestans]
MSGLYRTGTPAEPGVLVRFGLLLLTPYPEETTILANQEIQLVQAICSAKTKAFTLQASTSVQDRRDQRTNIKETHTKRPKFRPDADDSLPHALEFPAAVEVHVGSAVAASSLSIDYIAKGRPSRATSHQHQTLRADQRSSLWHSYQFAVSNDAFPITSVEKDRPTVCGARSCVLLKSSCPRWSGQYFIVGPLAYPTRPGYLNGQHVKLVEDEVYLNWYIKARQS